MLNGVSLIDDIKNLRDEAREMLIEDLRGAGYKMMDIQLLMDVLHILPPPIRRKYAKQRKFEEINIPKKCSGGQLNRTA